LACDGSSDSILVFLPGTGGDPDTIDIISAMQHRRVIGRPRVGDWTAVILSKDHPKKADMVINLDELKGTWVQMVTPTKKEFADDENISSEIKAEMDSVIKEMMKPIEQGFSLKRHYTAEGYGFKYNRDEENSPVIYPKPKYYTEWHVFNGKLVLTEMIRETDERDTVIIQKDTADFVFMTMDSLRLRFKDGEKGFYRKDKKALPTPK